MRGTRLKPNPHPDPGRAGTVLLVLGVLALGLGALWQFGLVPGSRVELPAPVALQAALQPPIATVEPLSTMVTEPAPVAAPAPTATAVPLVVPKLVAADAVDRTTAGKPEAGYAVRLAIPAISLDTVVEQGGIVADARGEPIWQTLPFVAVHYGDLTSLIGSPGNAVIAGHVVTLREGNVFRFLYRLEVFDQIQVWDDQQREHDFRVADVKLVPPSDTSVMAPTPDETLTLITCGGTFDPVKREFSDRLVIVAKPMARTGS